MSIKDILRPQPLWVVLSCLVPDGTATERGNGCWTATLAISTRRLSDPADTAFQNWRNKDAKENKNFQFEAFWNLEAPQIINVRQHPARLWTSKMARAVSLVECVQSISKCLQPQKLHCATIPPQNQFDPIKRAIHLTLIVIQVWI